MPHDDEARTDASRRLRTAAATARGVSLAFAAALAVSPGTAHEAFAAAPGRNGPVVTVVNDPVGGQPRQSVFAFSAAGAGPTRLAGPFNPVGNLAVSPDGARAAFIAAGATIKVMDLATGQIGPSVITGLDPYTRPAWSPDGRQLAFAARDAGTPAGQSRSTVWRVAADGSTPPVSVTSQVPAANELENTAIETVWAPDGQEIVFGRYVARCTTGVVVMSGCSGGGFTEEASQIQAVNLNGSLRTVTALTVHADLTTLPLGLDVAGDGSMVAYTADAGFDLPSRLHTVALAGGTPTVHASVIALGKVAFAPDGTEIVYRSVFDDNGTGRFELRAIRPNGTGDRRFAFDPVATGNSAPDWLPSLIEVAIGSGPPALTNATSAAFEFAAPGAPAGHFECRLDDFGFAPCTSPKSFTSLPDGLHRFQVRFDPDDAGPGPATERKWRVDTTPPVAVVDSQPSGNSNASDVTVEFHSSEPEGGTFDCALDGVVLASCTSPLRLTGLARGTHLLGIRAIDAAGNTQGGETTVLFGVIGTSEFPVRPASCSGSEVATVTFGPIVAIAPTTAACFDSETISGRSVRVSTGTVYVNGLRITPRAGAKIIVDGALGGGTVRSTGSVAVLVGTLGFNQDPLSLDSLRRATELRALGRVTGALLSLGAPVASPTVEFSADNGGQTKFNLSLKLPSVFTALPATSGQAAQQAVVSGDLGAVASNNLGVFFNGKAQISDLWLAGKVKLKDLTLGYDQGTGALEGSVGLALAKGAIRPPGINDDAVLTATVSIAPSALKLGLKASNLAVHLGYGFFFQRVGGSVEALTDGMRFDFTGGASWGPALNVEIRGVKIFSGEIVSLDGAYSLTVPSQSSADPVVVAATGQGKVFDIPFINGAVIFRNPGGIELRGTYDYTIGGYGFIARIDRAWFDPATDDFSIEASGESRLPPGPDLIFSDRVDVVVSTIGWVACFGENGFSAGFARRWAVEGLELFTDACDVGPFRRGPAAAQAAGDRSFSVPEGARVTVVEARGDGAPPKIRLSPPGGGPAIESPAARGLKRKDVLLIEDAARNATTVVLTRPAAGTWRIAALQGATLAGVRVADNLPPIAITAKVGGRGGRRTLSWRATGVRAQKLTFVERGAGGSAHRLTTTTKAAGRLQFAPSALVTGTRRRIEAIVTRRGLTRTTRVVARYTARVAPPSRATGVRRSGRQLTWKPVAGATSYAVALGLADDRSLPFVTRRARLTLPSAARRGRLTVRIVAIDAATRPGRATTVRFADPATRSPKSKR